MDPTRFPSTSLRTEIIELLEAAGEDNRLPVLPPEGVVSYLNEVGPTIRPALIPLVGAVLDRLYQDGIVGRVPGRGDVPHGYIIRSAAERAAKAGTIVMILPIQTPESPLSESSRPHRGASQSQP